ncbi:Transcription factor IIIC [Theobroma cacao]|nr:Transcription factor IIIC [Theobroma cacao]
MAWRFQAATLVASPSYPNSIAWSDENLIAVASGHIVTILNPALPFGPRGLVTVPKSEPYPIGVVKKEDLLSGCLLPTTLSREPRPCVRSISWSNLGMAPNSGCLLAVCTTEGHVKLYCPPFRDFSAEWIEVLDITDRLYDYLASISFKEPNIPPTEMSNEQVSDHPPDSVSGKECKRRRVNTSGIRNFGLETSCDQTPCYKKSKDVNAGSSPSSEAKGQGPCKVLNAKSGRLIGKSSHQTVPAFKSKGKSAKKMHEICSLPLITADQYASHGAMLSSLVVAWSPMLKLSSEMCLVPENDSSNWFSLLAVGAKSGKISFWRIHAPEYYSIEQSGPPTAVELIGILQVHNSWVTAISWALLASDSSNPQIININAVPVSVLSLMPSQSLHKILLAVGKGSGALEVWIGDISVKKFNRAGSYDAHDQVVTGLAWAFDGCFLYSCSQDNFVRSWSLRGSSLTEVAIPSSSPGLRSVSDLPDVFISCLGLVVSPSNLAVAMVRSFDVNQLDHMYEARLQKAAVEFFWIGGQQKDILSNTSLGFDIEGFPGFSEKELVYWESNILWSLKQYEYWDKPLVVWDIIAALLAFKQSASHYVDHVLVKWLSLSLVDSHVEHSIEMILPHVCKSFSKAASRQLHLLNIICRRVLLSEMKADEINSNLLNLGGLEEADFTQDKQHNLWMELLASSERELRERLVGFSFSAYKSIASNAASCSPEPGQWYPHGIPQMEQWVAHHNCHVHEQLKVLASEIRTCKRTECIELEAEEQCSYCSAPVPFDSPEFAFCKGLESTDGIGQKHKLARCAVCPTTPLWLCKCCNRWTSNLAPETLFMMSQYSIDFRLSPQSSPVKEVSKPLCPFCGILLQRFQPEFLLSALPV